MKSVILKSITLENFRSINRTIVLSDGETNIKGRNKSGKTSIINAWRWLLTGKVDSFHPANYELYDCTLPLTENTPSAIVRATIDIDGLSYVLERSAKPKFTLDKSTMEYVKSPSDKYTYKIDDIEYTATEFAEWISCNIAKYEILPFLVDGAFFVELVDSNRAKAMDSLLDIVGEITGDDFKEDYSCINEHFGKISEQSIVKHYQQTAREIKAELDAFPAQKQLIQKMLNEKSSVSYDAKEEERLKVKLADCTQRLFDSREQYKDEEDRKKTLYVKLRNLGLKLNNNREDYLNTFEARKREINRLIFEVSNEAQKRKAEYANLVLEKDRLLAKISSLDLELENARGSRDIYKAVADGGKVICPVCGCEIKEDNPIYKREKEEFDKIVERGWALRRERDNAKTELGDIVEKMVVFSTADLDERMEDLRKQLKDIENGFIEYEDTEEGKAILSEVAEINNKLSDVKTYDFSDIKQEEEDIRAQLRSIEESKAAYNHKVELENTLKTIDEDHKKKGVELAAVMQKQDKAVRRINERNEIASERVNGKMNDCFLQMWKLQKDGTKTPDCIILDKDGVKYGSTNTAERMKINIALQRLFMNHYDVSLPVFVDEASVFDSANKPKVDGQSVFVYASDDDEMIVEWAENER